MHKIRSYLVAGLLVWLPIVITLVVIRFIVDLLDSILKLLPRQYQPDVLFGVHVPGFGVVLSIALLIITGILVTNFLGKKLVALWDAFVSRIPLVRSIHSSVKQVLSTLFTPDGPSFRKVLLVEYPRKGMWSLAFQTATASPKIKKHLGDELLTIFIPTTPNPTSGFLMVIPQEDAIEMDMTVDEALKMVISLGVVQPGSITKKQTPLEQPKAD